ncbi:hypothetical protein NONI108955_30900 [Nocardia ninae]
MTSNIPVSWRVTVEDAWVEEEWTVVVVYRSQFFDGPLALRRTTHDPHSNTFSSMYSPQLSSAPDPVQFGRDVADFDIGEPLGTVTDHVRVDDNGIQWWGKLPATPDQPESQLGGASDSATGCQGQSSVHVRRPEPPTRTEESTHDSSC